MSRDMVSFVRAIRAGLSDAGVAFQVIERAPFRWSGVIFDAYHERADPAEVVSVIVTVLMAEHDADDATTVPTWAIDPEERLARAKAAAAAAADEAAEAFVASIGGAASVIWA